MGGANGEMVLASPLLLANGSLTITNGTLNLGTNNMLGVNRLQLTGASSVYSNSSSNCTLKFTLASSNLLIAVTGTSSKVYLDGNLDVNFDKNYMPAGTVFMVL